MDFKLLYRTVSHLKLVQVVFQITKRLIKKKYIQLSAPTHEVMQLKTEPIPRYDSLKDGMFSFLNLTHKFSGWDYDGNGALYAYNQNYFDFINSKTIEKEYACRWIDKFIAECSTITLGMDSYPIALRVINWAKFFCKYPTCATKERENVLWSHLKLLERKLEYHLLGNHLLEDLYSLYIGGCFFCNEELKNKAYKLLVRQLNEQTLSDGAHFEQSPMYHCILLDRLLDCINFGATNELKEIAFKQLGWLQAMCYADGMWPMFNDAAHGIAPSTIQIFDYAKRLGLCWQPTRLGESGYRKLVNDKIEVFVDCGNIMASYQPGHTHADSLNYELRIDGRPIVVDTGISTYNKTYRRQYERSTPAHNCVSVNGGNSDEVWGGFRVGRQCAVHIIKDEPQYIEAYHNGFVKKCRRKFSLYNGVFCVEDNYDGNAISYIHLADGISPDRVTVDGATRIEILNTAYSIEYNKLINNKTIAIHFDGACRYYIK